MATLPNSERRRVGPKYCSVRKGANEEGKRTYQIQSYVTSWQYRLTISVVNCDIPVFMENSVQSDFRSTVQPCFPPRTKPILRVLRSYTDVAPINYSNFACTYPQQLQGFLIASFFNVQPSNFSAMMRVQRFNAALRNRPELQ